MMNRLAQRFPQAASAEIPALSSFANRSSRISLPYSCDATAPWARSQYSQAFCCET